MHDVVATDDRDLRSFGAEYQCGRRKLDQAPRFEIKADLNIKPGTSAWFELGISTSTRNVRKSGLIAAAVRVIFPSIAARPLLSRFA